MDGFKKDIDNVCKMEYERGYADESLSVRAEVNENEYIRGLEDAWDLARRLTNPHNENWIDYDSQKEMFKEMSEGVIWRISIREVKSKIDFYDAKKEEKEDILIGDEVENEIGSKGIATLVWGDQLNVLVRDGSCLCACCSVKNWKKTGRHVDLVDLYEIKTRNKGEKDE